MQVLEIHKKLEEETHNMQKVPLKDKEVAVLKEMCNVGVQLIMLLCNNKISVWHALIPFFFLWKVVWRKLSNDDPSSDKTTESHALTNSCTEDIIYEDLL